MILEIGWDDIENDAKTITLTPGEAANAFNRIQDQCLFIANKYANATGAAFKGHAGKFDMQKSIKGVYYSLGGDGYGKRFDTVESIDVDGFECSYEYNEECHCHPHYVKFRERFPIDLLDYVDEALENKIREYTNMLLEYWKTENNQK